MHTNTWSLDWLVGTMYMLSPPKFRPHVLMVLSHDHLHQVCCTHSYMRVLWRLDLCCTVDFHLNNCHKYTRSSWLLCLTDIVLTWSLLPWYAAHSLKACQFRTIFNYIERGLSTYRDYAVSTENSHVRFYDVTTWSYVTLDDPYIEHVTSRKWENPFGSCCEMWWWCSWWRENCWCTKLSSWSKCTMPLTNIQSHLMSNLLPQAWVLSYITITREYI